MIDNELFFVLEEEHEISALRVIAAIDRNKACSSMGIRYHQKALFTPATNTFHFVSSLHLLSRQRSIE
jgi:hypothetical protein